ncbi:MAG TPA: HlyD family type I secretion periplasmic adaptor subunit [Thermohalobaculum sp.]|nr:HlyD family type I secretion periplasmic adaptor subunit [Thermohalobaculum sp.]
MRNNHAPDGWSAGSYIRLGLFCVVVLGAGLGGWAATANLHGAVISTGQLGVENRRQVVQHPDGGVVSEILVREGDLIEAGAVLIRLDGSRLASELTVLESQLYELMARRGRLEAEQAERDRIAFDPELLAAVRIDPRLRSLIDGQQALFEARISTMANEIDVLRERQEQIREQITGAQAEIASLDRQRVLIGQELEAQQELLRKGLAQASRVLGLEREAARLDGERGRLVSQAAQLKGQISEIEIELLRLGAARREEALAQLREFGFRELELQERRIALRERLARLDLRAPLGGIVLDMTVHALQGVVRPAEPILHIVPTGSALIINAEVDPTHIDAVHPGQEAVLRFSAFNARTTPVLLGTVSKVSPDAFFDGQTRRSYFRAEVVLSEGEMAKLEGQQLVAGMPVEVFIQTGRRTPIEYLVKPITDYLNRAMRED